MVGSELSNYCVKNTAQTINTLFCYSQRSTITLQRNCSAMATLLATEDTCACKGIRTCKICELQGKRPATIPKLANTSVYFYCDLCGSAFDNTSPWKQHPDHLGNKIVFPGIVIIREFVTPEEEKNILQDINSVPFVVSQSGRRKQDYGPKVNFKRKKVKAECFTGLPRFSELLFNRIKDVQCLTDFIPVELCNLEYTPERGSSIDPHFDDFWLWGKRLVTLNLGSDSFLCMTHEQQETVEVHVPLFQRSLLVVYGAARYQWKHGIHREDICDTRIAITLRELSEEFQKGGTQEGVGQKLIDIALTFNGKSVGS